MARDTIKIKALHADIEMSGWDGQGEILIEMHGDGTEYCYINAEQARQIFNFLEDKLKNLPNESKH